jgi:TrmH family RNA methyltransferase
MTITSPHNEKLKEIRKLTQRKRWREQAGRFVAEGEDLLQAADAAGWTPVERYCAAGSGLPGTEVDPTVLATISGLKSGTRALAVYEERWAPTPAGPLCVYLHGVSDPGNVGAVLRSAEAFGASAVAIGPGTADPFGPKAVRASMGAVFVVPLSRVKNITGLPGRNITGLPGRTIALSAGQGRPLHELDLSLQELDLDLERGPADGVSLLIGAERDGLPAQVIESADDVAQIPIHTHSLNAAMAATVALYEATRMARG